MELHHSTLIRSIRVLSKGKAKKEIRNSRRNFTTKIRSQRAFAFSHRNCVYSSLLQRNLAESDKCKFVNCESSTDGAHTIVYNFNRSTCTCACPWLYGAAGRIVQSFNDSSRNDNYYSRTKKKKWRRILLFSCVAAEWAFGRDGRHRRRSKHIARMTDRYAKDHQMSTYARTHNKLKIEN